MPVPTYTNRRLLTEVILSEATPLVASNCSAPLRTVKVILKDCLSNVFAKSVLGINRRTADASYETKKLSPNVVFSSEVRCFSVEI